MEALIQWGIGVWFGDRSLDRRGVARIGEEFLVTSSLFRLLTKRRILENVLEETVTSGEPLMIVSSVCPPYSTDEHGRPTYQGLNCGIEHNIRQHLEHVPRGVKLLRDRGVKTIHFFLMADTEVDLLPFLKRLELSPGEFTRRCQGSVEAIAEEVRLLYPEVSYKAAGIPPAARFLDYFGHERWYQTYEFFRERLFSEAINEPEGRVARSLECDSRFRSVLIAKLLGVVDKKTQIEHIARQKAQYMAFASLMRDQFEGRLVVVNHKTPNFGWMNDQLVRVHPDSKQTEMGNFLPKLPLLELNIETMPGG